MEHDLGLKRRLLIFSTEEILSHPLDHQSGMPWRMLISVLQKGKLADGIAVPSAITGGEYI